MKDNISDIKNKYKKDGFSALSQRERLILFLSYSEKGCIEGSADRILSFYGDLGAAADGDVFLTMKECGISQSSAILLNLVSALSRRSEIVSLSKNKLNTSENAKKYFSAYLMNKRIEYAAAAAANEKFNIINTVTLGSGGFSEVHFPIRSLVEFALKNDAAYIFVSHCHPKYNASPSRSDISTTKKIKTALDSIGVCFADHIITGINGAVSMRECTKGLFDPLDKYISDNVSDTNLQ